MPGQFDNSAVFDPYPFADIPDFAPTDPDPDPETLGLQAYASEPPQPVIFIAPLIRPLIAGIRFGATLTPLDYLPNEILPAIELEVGIAFGVDIYNVIAVAGIGFGVDIFVPPTISAGIRFGVEIELTEPQELQLISSWEMNDPLFLDSVSGYDLLPVTLRTSSTPYTDPIDQVTGVGGYTRFPSSGAPRLISPSNTSFTAVEGESIDISFEFYLEDEDIEFFVGVGTVGTLTADGTRNQCLIYVRFTGTTYQITSFYFLDAGGSSADSDTAVYSTNISINQWHSLRVQFNLTSREHVIEFNNDIYTEQFDLTEETPWQSLNPGLWIDPTLIGTFRLRNLEYKTGTIAYPDLFLLPGIKFGCEFTVESTGGGAPDLVASWDLNDVGWSDSVGTNDFAISDYSPYLAYADTPTIIGGTGGYTVFNNDTAFNGLVLRSPYDVAFESTGDLTFEFEIYADPFPASNAQVLFESSDFSGSGFQWRIETVLYYDFDLDAFFHQIKSSFWLYDTVNEYAVAEEATHTLLLSNSTWHSVKVEFKPSTDETIITIDAAAESFPFSNPSFPAFLMALSAIGIGNGYWWSEFRFRNVRFSKEP